MERERVIQYGAKLLIPILHLRARLQHRAGLRQTPISSSAPALAKLASIISDARMLWRIWGLLPIIQWLISLERSPPPTRSLLTIERAQGWSMLAYYPMEHLYYLLAHDIIPSSIPLPSLPFIRSASSSSIQPSPSKEAPSPALTLSLNSTSLSLWSCRFWAVYVVLQLAHLREDRTLLLKRERALSKEKVKGLEHEELKARRDAWWNELAVNLGSLEKGLFKNNIWESVFGFVAALASFRSGWKATALPAVATLPPLTEDVETTEKEAAPLAPAGELEGPAASA
ncbi:hypothetical protein EW146_g5122 [Bondarzewia mesenterica]|uniref:Uncharacterized protein n=1 Tax=Bondarzewia mesenterica TaxID=1095465 RepID=A0A4S4LSF2_9AGAM|nr:hypothetical protein EW146_g5122 [Bondarzewia mesenterica]